MQKCILPKLHSSPNLDRQVNVSSNRLYHIHRKEEAAWLKVVLSASCICSQVGNLFGSHRSTIITLYNGAFDSSSALFLVIKVGNIHKLHMWPKQTHPHVVPLFCFFLQLLHEAGISLRASFIFLSACGVIHLLRTFFLLPRKFIPHPLPDHYTYGYNNTCDTCFRDTAMVCHKRLI